MKLQGAFCNGADFISTPSRSHLENAPLETQMLLCFCCFPSFAFENPTLHSHVVQDIFFRSVCASPVLWHFAFSKSSFYLPYFEESRRVRDYLIQKGCSTSLPAGPGCRSTAPLPWLFAVELGSAAEWQTKRLFITLRLCIVIELCRPDFLSKMNTKSKQRSAG